MNFADRLDAAVRAKQSVCLLGLDPHLELLPPPFAVASDPSAPRAARAAAIADFCCELIDLCADRVPAVKPQSAFFEVFGADGAAAWERVIAHARSRDLLVVADVKRGDIASTARAYALAHLAPTASDAGRADAITINPYLGTDALEPFVEVCREHGAGAFVLVRTSNPGSARYQLEGDPPLAERVAADVARLGEGLRGECGWSSLGAVVGATHASELARWRELMPRTLLLLPGYGAQGATARDIAPAFGGSGGESGSEPGSEPNGGSNAAPNDSPLSGALVASSRGIAFAYRSAADRSDWRAAADRALDAMLADLAGALGLHQR